MSTFRFEANPMWLPIINGSFFVSAKRDATSEDIDQGVRLGSDHPVGPPTVSELMGLDVVPVVLCVFCCDFVDSKGRAGSVRLRCAIRESWSS